LRYIGVGAEDNFLNVRLSGAIGQTESTVGDIRTLFRGSQDLAWIIKHQLLSPLRAVEVLRARRRLKS
jgi:hypothetical protein